MRQRSARTAILLAGWLCAAFAAQAAADDEKVRIAGGRYEPFYRTPGEGPLEVAAFEIDRRPVTNAEFLAFVREQPRWQRSRVSPLFASAPYLSHWSADLELGPAALPEQPVTFVSWFAAVAYCRSRGGRLPSEAEWELAAAPPAGDDEAAAETARRILAFYSRPRGTLPRVGSTPPNGHGVQDLHGVIWEWVEDFNAGLGSADSRKQGDKEADAVCGGAASAAGDTSDYATFMRFAFRSSLEATHALHHLGFRCARSLP